MPMTTLKEIRDNIASTTRETQVSSLIDSFINLTGLEIHLFHPWTFLRRKQTFATVTSQEDYNLDSEIDRIAVLRQITTPTRLLYIPDSHFYDVVPDPENQSTGPSRYYRLWEETGFSTNLAADDTIYVSSSSASDTSTFTVRVVGRNSSGEVVAETLTLNGTSNVTSSTTWDAAGLMAISKSAATTGTITCYRTTGATVLSEMEPDNLAPRFKRLSLYPVPSSAVTMYLEYYERYRALVHATDVPQIDSQWAWVLREGALARMWEYKQSEQLSLAHRAIFQQGLLQMRQQDERNVDYIPVIQARQMISSVIRRYSDSVNDNFPVYGLTP